MPRLENGWGGRVYNLCATRVQTLGLHTVSGLPHKNVVHNKLVIPPQTNTLATHLYAGLNTIFTLFFDHFSPVSTVPITSIINLKRNKLLVRSAA